MSAAMARREIGSVCTRERALDRLDMIRCSGLQPIDGRQHIETHGERMPEIRNLRGSHPPARPSDREQKRALVKCFDVMRHALIEREKTAGAKTERPA